MNRFHEEIQPLSRGILMNHPRRPNIMDVTILLGSSSDLPIAEKCTKILDHFSVTYQLRVASAHRSPVFVEEIKCKNNGYSQQ